MDEPYEHDPRQLTDLAGGLTAVDNAVRKLVCAEVASMIPELEEFEETHAHVLQTAISALAPGEKELADLDSEIAAMDSEAQPWRDQAAGSDIPTRVAAKMFLAECEREMTPLREKREQLEQDLLPARQAVRTARKR